MTLLLGGALAALVAAGCQEAGSVRLVPVFPDDRPEILTDLGIESLEVRFFPQGEDTTNEQQWVTVERGGSLALKLAPGSWKAVVRGVGASAEVRGETVAFQIEVRVDREVPFFLGEAGAFNLARLEPAEVADQLAGLSGHTATLYAGLDDRPRILVAGGRRDGELSVKAFVIDPVEFTIEGLPNLSCARADHTALLVDVEAGRRVVLAGGVGSCAASMDVYDTAGEAFFLASVCGVNDARPAVAEVARVSGQLVQTGRVIAPGNPRCVVDVFDPADEGEHDVPAVDTGPDAPIRAVANSQGQVLVVTPQRLFLDEAEQGRSCIEGGSWIKDATWFGIEERVGGQLTFLGNDQFLFAGGRPPGEGDPLPSNAWTVVSLLRDCALSRVMDGVRPDDAPPASGFAMIDVGSGASLAMLMAGGVDAADEPVARVTLLAQPTQAAAPTLHDLSSAARERPIRLVYPRAGAAAVPAPDGNAWLIGGGDPRPELFVGGAGLTTTWDRFDRRKPTMRVYWILDNGGDAPGTWFDLLLPDFRDKVVKRIVQEFYLKLRTMVLLATNSDRGLDVADLGVGFSEVKNGSGCGDTPTAISVVAVGDLDDVYLPGSVVEIPDEGQSGSPEIADEIVKEIDKIFVQLGQDRTGCAWRQFYRRAFDGVSEVGEGGAAAVDLTTGITLVLLGARDDDCSQGVFDDGSTFVGVPPPAGTLATRHCTEISEPWASEFDAYFGLPPGGPSDEDLGRIVERISWDPRDTFFVHLGRLDTDPDPDTDSEPQCPSLRYGALEPSRRLRETLEWIEGRGVRTASVDLCGVVEGEDLVGPMNDVVDLVSEQLPWQACLSLAVAGGKAAYDQNQGEFVPVAREDPAAEETAGLARQLCRAITVVEDGADAKHYRAIPVDLTDCWAGTDSDRRAGCATDESGWLIRCERLSTVLEMTMENNAAEFICLP
jgi:hypothetical protein